MPLTVDPAPADDLGPEPEPPEPACRGGPARTPEVTYERLAVPGPVTDLQQLDNASGKPSRVTALPSVMCELLGMARGKHWQGQILGL